MKLPSSIFEDQDISLLESKIGNRVRKEGDWIILTKTEWSELKSLVMGNNLLEYQERCQRLLVMKAIGHFFDLKKEAKTVSEKAHMVSLCLEIQRVSPSVALALCEEI